MTPSSPLEILDLRHFPARQLRPLLLDEAAQWQRRLRWDYTKSVELLLQYLESRVLPGFVALDRGRITGYTFCVYEAHKAVLGDVYAFPSSTDDALAVDHLLLRHLVEVLLHSPNIDRIESQLLLYKLGDLNAGFAAAPFRFYPRLFMERDLPLRPSPAGAPEPKHAETDQPGTGTLSHLALQPWSAPHYQLSAELILESYLGHIDADINDQYRTLHGTLRFLHNIVRFPGCGVFDPAASWVIEDRTDGKLAAVILCSRVSPEAAHITQLCVSPRYRGHRLGRLLLEQTALCLSRNHVPAITLTVTEANQPAVHLYTELGFTTTHRFEAMVYDKRW